MFLGQNSQDHFYLKACQREISKNIMYDFIKMFWQLNKFQSSKVCYPKGTYT